MQTGDGDPASSLVFSVVLVHSNSLGLQPGLATDTVPAAQLGLQLAPGCHAVLAAAEGGAAQLEAVSRVCVAAAEEAGATAVPLPVRGPGSWSLVFISPVLAMLGGQLDLVLIGETQKVKN